MTKQLDYPFYECAATAEKLIEKGAEIYQKFSCEKCGQRLTIEEPNRFYMTGDCDKCGHVTNIVERGCNYMVTFAVKRPSAAGGS